MTSTGPAIVTGSHGFVGSALARALPGHVPLPLGARDWRAQLASVDFAGATVFHLAARVHAPGGREQDFVHDNVDKTEALAVAGAKGGARRLVFASTLKVLGDETHAARFDETSPALPGDAYARSKRMAEERLAEVARFTGLAVAIVRPPLVIGPGAKANLAGVLSLADTPWPLPFASIRNRRSWVHVDDLCALLRLCAVHPSAPGRAWLAAHDEPFSTPGLFGETRRALARAPRLFAFPPTLLERAGVFIGARDRVLRLTRSFEADASATVRELGWRPRVGFAQAIAGLVEGRIP